MKSAYQIRRANGATHLGMERLTHSFTLSCQAASVAKEKRSPVRLCAHDRVGQLLAFLLEDSKDLVEVRVRVHAVGEAGAADDIVRRMSDRGGTVLAAVREFPLLGVGFGCGDEVSRWRVDRLVCVACRVGHVQGVTRVRHGRDEFLEFAAQELAVSAASDVRVRTWYVQNLEEAISVNFTRELSSVPSAGRSSSGLLPLQQSRWH